MKKRLFKLAFLAFMLVVIPSNIKAVTFSVIKSTDNVKPGSTVLISVMANDVNSVDSLYGYALTLKYDGSLIDFVNDEGTSYSNLSNNPGTLTINSKFSEGLTSDVEVARFNVRVKDGVAAGSSNFNLSGTCKINDDTGDCTYNGSSLSVAALGTDASLSSLSIPNTTLSPGFSSDVTDYKATVQDITSVTVDASATDPNATIAITDNYKSLQKGDNKIDIVVTSEDGNNKKTYTVVVTLNVTPTAEELLKQDTTLKSLTIKNQKLDFDKAEKKYYLTVENSVDSLNITAVPTNEKAKVQIEGNKKINVGKNTIKITVTSEDGTKTDTYQIIVTKKEAEKEITQTCPNLNNMGNWNAFIWIIITVIALVTFTLGIFLGYILCKKGVLQKLFKKKEKEEVPVEIETLSDTIDLSETLKTINDGNNKKKKGQ